ncbi:LysR family transcriptional regulator [Raoultella terrigena]|jgi:DNA-binding transcriptional LysR family regulator|uniref:LysR family transcriptional regulator n=1 Tax=Raoultella terrigena TaxID=577 RepID=UPI000695E87B|nr:LysR family transcriptional regulator [Raoultella terrigena]
MSGIDIRLLRAFVTLAEKGNYNKAAETLFLTQPALSKQIQMLEQKTGGQLFLRGRHGAVLTMVGRQLFAKAHELLKSHRDFLTYAQDLQKGSTGKLVLGFGISSFKSTPVWINIFRQKFPDCDVVISQIPSSVQVRMLMEGELHAGFVRMPVTKLLASRLINKENLVLAVPVTVDIDPADLQHTLAVHPILCMDPAANPCLAEQTTVFLRDHELIAEPVSATNNIHSLLALIAGGNGIALLPASVGNFLPVGVKLVTLWGTQVIWNIGVAWNPKIDNQMRDEFLQIVTRDLP